MILSHAQVGSNISKILKIHPYQSRIIYLGVSLFAMRYPVLKLVKSLATCPFTLVRPHFYRTLSHILPGIPLGPKPTTSPLKNLSLAVS